MTVIVSPPRRNIKPFPTPRPRRLRTPLPNIRKPLRQNPPHIPLRFPRKRLHQQLPPRPQTLPAKLRDQLRQPQRRRLIRRRNPRQVRRHVRQHNIRLPPQRRRNLCARRNLGEVPPNKNRPPHRRHPQQIRRHNLPPGTNGNSGGTDGHSVGTDGHSGGTVGHSGGTDGHSVETNGFNFRNRHLRPPSRRRAQVRHLHPRRKQLLPRVQLHQLKRRPRPPSARSRRANMRVPLLSFAPLRRARLCATRHFFRRQRTEDRRQLTEDGKQKTTIDPFYSSRRSSVGTHDSAAPAAG